MIRRSQQGFALLIFLILAFCAGAILDGHVAIAVAGVTSLVALYSVIFGYEFFLVWKTFARTDALRPSGEQISKAFRLEFVSAPAVFLWRQPFRSNAEPDLLSSTNRRKRGVIFIHGFVCNRGIWNPLTRRLRRSGIPFIAVNLEPVFGSIDDYVALVDAAVTKLRSTTDLPPVIVAHSMGGLAARAWLQRGQSRFEDVHALVTIATPHHGTSVARHSSFANARQMQVGSAWLSGLAKQEAGGVRCPVICFWSHCDNIVIPSRNATLSGADNRHLEATPHLQMVYHPAILEEVFRLVEDRPDDHGAVLSERTPRRT